MNSSYLFYYHGFLIRSYIFYWGLFVTYELVRDKRYQYSISEWGRFRWLCPPVQSTNILVWVKCEQCRSWSYCAFADVDLEVWYSQKPTCNFSLAHNWYYVIIEYVNWLLVCNIKICYVMLYWHESREQCRPILDWMTVQACLDLHCSWMQFKVVLYDITHCAHTANLQQMTLESPKQKYGGSP